MDDLQHLEPVLDVDGLDEKEMANFDVEQTDKPIDDKALHRLRQDFEKDLSAAGIDLEGKLAVDAYIDLFDKLPESTPYNDVPSAVEDMGNAIVALGGEQALDVYHRLVLLQLIGRFEQRAARYRLPRWLEGRTRAYFHAIINDVQKTKPRRFLLKHDGFLQDLGVCRIKLWPCGVELVETGCSLNLRWLLQKKDVAQSVRALIHIGFSVRGTAPVLASHFDKRRPQEFSPEGYLELYLNIARLLRAMPDHLGLLSSSWWHDPAVGQMSPQLAFLNELPMSGGARIYRIGTDETAVSKALCLSRERTEAYRNGTYHPAFYHLIWSRKSLLGWAGDQMPISPRYVRRMEGERGPA